MIYCRRKTCHSWTYCMVFTDSKVWNDILRKSNKDLFYCEFSASKKPYFKDFSASMEMVTELIELYFVKLQFMVVIKVVNFIFFYQYSMSFIYSVYCISLSIAISFFIYIYIYIYVYFFYSSFSTTFSYFIYLFTCLFIYLFIYLFVYLFICLFLCLLVFLFFALFRYFIVCLIIHS